MGGDIVYYADLTPGKRIEALHIHQEIGLAIRARDAAQKGVAEAQQKIVDLLSPYRPGNILRKKGSVQSRIPHLILIVAAGVKTDNDSAWFSYNYRVINQATFSLGNLCLFYRFDDYELVPEDDPIYEKVKLSYDA